MHARIYGGISDLIDLKSRMLLYSVLFYAVTVGNPFRGQTYLKLV